MGKEKAKFSGYDSRGYVMIDCAECARGGNGNASCSSGWRIKTGGKGTCFHGDLIEKLELSKPEDQKSKKDKGAADEVN